MWRNSRRFVLILLRWIGILRLFQFLHRNQIAILTVHGVMDDRDSSLWKPLRRRLSRDELEDYLKALSKRYRFISLEDAVEMLQGCKPIQPYSIVLTFDDGHRNHITHALPILRRYKAPATFFVPTGFINNLKPFWFDRLDYALQQAHVHNSEVRIGSFTIRIDDSNRERLRESYKRLRGAAKEQQMSDQDFLREINQLANQLEADSGKALADIQNEDDWSAIASWEQIRKVLSDHITIGSHTVDHIRLGLVGAEYAYDQLERSKKDIERYTGSPCHSLCYPNGSFTEETVDIAKKCGYLYGVTTRKGLNSIGDDVFRLRRINVPIGIRATYLLARICSICG